MTHDGRAHARGAPLPLLPRPDVVLAADCVYFEPAFPLLVRTLAALVPRDAPGPDADVLFCYKKRRKVRARLARVSGDARLMVRAAGGPAVLRAAQEGVHLDGGAQACRAVCAGLVVLMLCMPQTYLKVLDDPDRDVYAREAISLLRLSRRR